MASGVTLHIYIWSEAIYIYMYVCMYIYIYCRVLVRTPLFPWNHETCENVAELENGTVKSARQWGSVTHPQNEVAFSAFLGFALPGAPWLLRRRRCLGTHSPQGKSGLSFFQRLPFFVYFIFCATWSRRTRRSRIINNQKGKEQKEKVKSKEGA